MSAPRLSVVISTRNRASMLVGALRALVQQDAALPYEVVVVDNGSTDGTWLVARQFARDYPARVRAIAEPRPGVSHGRNAGIAASRADVLAFTDDDVLVSPGWVAAVLHAAARTPDVDAFGGKVLPIWPAPAPRWLTREHWSPLAIQDFGDEPFAVDAARPRCLVAANLVARRAAFERVGLFSPSFPRAQDHEWQLRLWRAGGTMRYEPGLVVRAPVEIERLSRAYHWRWEGRNGRYCARMRLREVIGPDGTLRADQVRFRRILGAPRATYRELVREAFRAVLAAFRDPLGGEAFGHAVAARHLAGYLAESARLRREPVVDGILPRGRREAIRV